jgi:radical SAM/Cys-rich protein
MEALTALFIKHRVILMASFPSLNEEQTDSQRGPGTFKTSLNVLRKLNSLGYGQTDSGLELHLVSNPNGAFLHSSQMQMEKRFREILGRKWGIVFNRLLSLANVPLGRYRQWLTASGTLEQYMAKLSSAFNACALEGLMCKTLVSVSWEGILYDCDFNSAAGLYLGGRRIHVSEMAGLPAPGTAIAVSDYCLTCAAGAGFT